MVTLEEAPEEPDIDSIKVWVVGTGPWDRSYFEDVFVEYGVALVGCSDVRKRYTTDLEKDPDFRDLSRNLKSSIRTIANKMKRGDLVIARRGRSVVLGLGVVRGESENEYDYREEWAEIQGWDLYHQVRVEWLEVDGLGDGREMLFEYANGRAIKPFASAYVVHEVSNRDARKWALEHGARRALEVAAFDGEDLSDLPELPEARGKLMRKEVRPWFWEAKKTFENLLDSWCWHGISESSVIAHVIVPMLMHPALGWKRTQIKLEEHWVDVQVADGEGSPVLLIEAKAPRFGISAARRQVLGYWEEGREKEGWGSSNPWLMATNGVNFTLEQPDDPGSRVEANLRMPTSRAIDFIETLADLAKR